MGSDREPARLRSGPRERAGTALVLGARGKLGRALYRRALPTRFFRVVGLDRRGCDITRGEQIEAALDTYRPQVVFNAAAVNDVDGAELQHALAFRVNAIAVDQLAQATRSRGIRLVHFSSNFVFGDRMEGGFDEGDPPRPLSRYGSSKYEGERAVLGQGGRDHLVIRLMGLYDEHGACFPRTVLRAALQQGWVRVVQDRYGSLAWSEDVAERAAELAAEKVSGLLHLAPPDDAPWAEVASSVLRMAGVRAELRGVSAAEQGVPARRPLRAQLLSKRAGELGLPPLLPWEEGLQAFFRMRGEALLASLREELAGAS